VEKRGDVGYLFISHVHQGRHALIGAAAANHFSDLIALDVMRDKGRANQIRSTSASGVGAVAESAGFRELFAAAPHGWIWDGRILRNGLRPGDEMTKGKNKEQR
jgi:hypothetical protein